MRLAALTGSKSWNSSILNWKNSSNSHKQGLRGILIPNGGKCPESGHFAAVLSPRQVVIAETTTVNSTGPCGIRNRQGLQHQRRLIRTCILLTLVAWNQPLTDHRI
jgi:hypothetical protein